MVDHAKMLQRRLRADLRAAMLARKTEDVSVLRSLLALIDNAQAVSVGNLHDKYIVRDFGDASVEVPRKYLSHEDLRALLDKEVASCTAASDEYNLHGRDCLAEKMSREAMIIRRYVA